MKRPLKLNNSENKGVYGEYIDSEKQKFPSDTLSQFPPEETLFVFAEPVMLLGVKAYNTIREMKRRKLHAKFISFIASEEEFGPEWGRPTNWRDYEDDMIIGIQDTSAADDLSMFDVGLSTYVEKRFSKTSGSGLFDVDAHKRLRQHFRQILRKRD